MKNIVCFKDFEKVVVEAFIKLRGAGLTEGNMSTRLYESWPARVRSGRSFQCVSTCQMVAKSTKYNFNICTVISSR